MVTLRDFLELLFSSLDRQFIEARPIVQRYYNRELQVDVRTFAENRRSLVTAIHQARGSRPA